MKEADDIEELKKRAQTPEPKKNKSEKGRIHVNFDDLTADDDLDDPRISLRSILGGDIFTAKRLLKQLPLMAMIVVFLIIYIGNRYSSQTEMIETEQLRAHLDDVKSLALTHSSALLEKTRQSRIENYLKNSNDSTIQSSNIPPFVIKAD